MKKPWIQAVAILGICLMVIGQIRGEVLGSEEELIQEALNFKMSQYKGTDVFILKDSDKQKLTEEDIWEMDSEILGFARNEIYARHGYIFKDSKYKEYFESKTWYTPKEEKIEDSALNEIEKYNINLIKLFEKQRTYSVDTDSGVAPSNIYSADKQIQLDINGDGKKEKIQYKILEKSDYGNPKCKLIVNNTSIVFQGVLAPQFAIVDIDKKDPYKEIMISDYGPSSDYTTKYYIFKENKLIYIGETEGVYDHGIQIDGTGTFTAKTRADILQTWWFNKKFYLDSNHKIKPIPTTFYETDYQVFLKKSYPFYKERDIKSQKFEVSEGQIITLVGHDNKDWCKIKTEEGKEGWFKVSEVNEKIGTVEVFAGLSFAD